MLDAKHIRELTLELIDKFAPVSEENPGGDYLRQVREFVVAEIPPRFVGYTREWFTSDRCTAIYCKFLSAHFIHLTQ